VADEAEDATGGEAQDTLIDADGHSSQDSGAECGGDAGGAGYCVEAGSDGAGAADGD